MGLRTTYPYLDAVAILHLQILGIIMIFTAGSSYLLPKSINRPMGKIRDFYSNEVEMKEMKIEKTDGEENKPDSNLPEVQVVVMKTESKDDSEKKSEE